MRLSAGITVLFAIGCGSSPAAPSATPATSSLTWHLAAGTVHSEASGDYTPASATFGGSVRTTCVPNPNIAGSVCPDLMVLVRPSSGRGLCQLLAFAPAGESLRPSSRTYQSQRGARPGFAGLDFNCSGAPNCNWSVGQFTLHELIADDKGIVRRAHVTFEQTCVDLVTALCRSSDRALSV